MDRLRGALADRYRLERQLGQGGMATVYLAEDFKHHRQVAIKVLRPELAAVLGAERFLQEITTTAQLQHPHILPLFDSGQADGFLYYVMPYVEGETLRARLDREKQLGVDEAVRITREVADALDYAHRHGVIHRDIKPENILLHDGRPMVADFGIALAVSAAGGERMTETGLTVGTPHYMSPEQATADKEITGRSDIYSLASVLYEMLTGHPPHVGGSAQQIVMKIIAEPVAPVTTLRKSVPGNVSAAVEQGLEKLPADRFESAKAFADALANPHFTTPGTTLAGSPRSRAAPWSRDPRSIALGAVALVSLAGFGWALGRRAPVPAVPVSYDVTLPDSAPIAPAYSQAFAVSPGGDFLIYQAHSDGESALWYRSLTDATTRQLNGTNQARRSAISPDGSRVAFLRFSAAPKWTLEVIPVAGGDPATLGEGTGPTSLDWLDDGRIQVVEGDGNHTRWFDPGGGPTTARRTPYCILPFYLTGRDQFLCGGGGVMWAEVADLSDAGGKRPLWTAGSDSSRVFGSSFQVVDGRYLVYLSMGGDLLAAPVDFTTRRVGRSARLLTGLERSAYLGAGTYGISRAGTLVYAQGPNRAVGNLVATDGRSPDSLGIGPDAYRVYAMSPDGRRLAAVVDGLQGMELRVYNLGTGDHVVWIRHHRIHQPVWSPRGDRLLFALGDSIFVGRPDRSETPTLLAVAPESFEAFSWVSERRVLGGLWTSFLAVSFDPTSTPTVWDTLAREATFPVGSPDGRWMAYNDVDYTTVWLAPLPATGQRYQVATGSVGEPRWLSGRELVFGSYDEETSIHRAVVDFSGASPSFTRRTWMPLTQSVETAGQSFQLTPDGRVLYVRGAKVEPSRFLRVIPDWVNQMKRAVDEANR